MAREMGFFPGKLLPRHPFPHPFGVNVLLRGCEERLFELLSTRVLHSTPQTTVG